MAFVNSVEFKITSFIVGPNATTVTLYVYRVFDGGIVDGIQQYTRTLVNFPNRTQPLTFKLDAGLDRPRIRAIARQRLADIVAQYSLNFAPENQLCDL